MLNKRHLFFLRTSLQAGLLMLTALFTSSCIFDDDDERSEDETVIDDPSEVCDVSVIEQRNSDKVTNLLSLHSFHIVNLEDQDGYDEDNIAAYAVNYSAPNDIQGNTCDEETPENYFDLTATSWQENNVSRAWKESDIAPNEDAAAKSQRKYFLLDSSNEWQEVSSTNETELLALEGEIIETHLGVKRQWIADTPEITIEGSVFDQKLDRPSFDLALYKAWLDSFGMVRDADAFSWAVNNEHIDHDDQFSDGAEVHYVFKYVLEQRYQIEQVQVLANNYIYPPVYLGDLSTTNYPDLDTGYFVDGNEGAGLAFRFRLGSVPNCVENTEEAYIVGDALLYDISAVQSADDLFALDVSSLTQINDFDELEGRFGSSTVVRKCLGNEVVLIIEMTADEKHRAGMDGSYDLFLVQSQAINSSGVIYYGKRYNVTEKSYVEAGGLVPQLYYNKTAIDDIKRIFKLWRDEDYKESL